MPPASFESAETDGAMKRPRTAINGRAVPLSERQHFLSMNPIRACFLEIVALKAIKACLAERVHAKKVEKGVFFA